jgi:hypothetical protein
MIELAGAGTCVTRPHHKSAKSVINHSIGHFPKASNPAQKNNTVDPWLLDLLILLIF